MTDAVLRSTEGRIGILTVNNPPVNALAAAVRNGIKEGVEAFGNDPNIDAIVLIGGGRTFIAGADIREFGKPPSGANLNDVIAKMKGITELKEILLLLEDVYNNEVKLHDIAVRVRNALFKALLDEGKKP